CFVDEVLELLLGHSFFYCVISRLVGRQSSLCRESHQRNLMRTLDHAASRRNWCRANEASLWRRLRDAIDKNKLDRLFNAQLACADAEIFQPLSDALIWTFIFLPNSDVRLTAIGRVGDLFACSSFFESRTDIERFALCGKYKSEHAFAAPPADAGEV